MADVFEEVEEQLRSARYQSLIKKGWPYLVAVVVIAVIAYGGYWFVRDQQRTASAKASETYQLGLEAVDRGDRPAAEKNFAAVAKSGPPAYRAAALMQQAAFLTTDRKPAQAVALFDQAAGLAKDPVIADAARLKAAYAIFDTASLAELEKRLTPLSAAGRPYAALAREALAVKRMASGQTAAARQTFSLLAISPEAGQGLQARAGLAMAVIDAGQAKNLTAAAAAAAALPPGSVPPAPPPGAEQGAPQSAPPSAPPPTGAPQ